MVQLKSTKDAVRKPGEDTGRGGSSILEDLTGGARPQAGEGRAQGASGASGAAGNTAGSTSDTGTAETPSGGSGKGGASQESRGGRKGGERPAGGRAGGAGSAAPPPSEAEPPPMPVLATAARAPIPPHLHRAAVPVARGFAKAYAVAEKRWREWVDVVARMRAEGVPEEAIERLAEQAGVPVPADAGDQGSARA